MAYDAILNTINLPRRYVKDEKGTVHRAVPKVRMSKKERLARRHIGKDPEVEAIMDDIMKEATRG